MCAQAAGSNSLRTRTTTKPRRWRDERIAKRLTKRKVISCRLKFHGDIYVEFVPVPVPDIYLVVSMRFSITAVF